MSARLGNLGGVGGLPRPKVHEVHATISPDSIHVPGFSVAPVAAPPPPAPPSPPAFRVHRLTREERRLARLGRPGGRPSRFSPAWVPGFLALLRAGNFRAPAARATGQNPHTVRWWCRVGRVDPTSVFGPFVAAVERAEAEFEMQAMRYVTRAMVTNPGLVLALLARRFPERFSPRAGLTVAAEDAEAEAEERAAPRSAEPRAGA